MSCVRRAARSLRDADGQAISAAMPDPPIQPEQHEPPVTDETNAVDQPRAGAPSDEAAESDDAIRAAEEAIESVMDSVEQLHAAAEVDTDAFADAPNEASSDAQELPDDEIESIIDAAFVSMEELEAGTPPSRPLDDVGVDAADAPADIAEPAAEVEPDATADDPLVDELQAEIDQLTTESHVDATHAAAGAGDLADVVAEAMAEQVSEMCAAGEVAVPDDQAAGLPGSPVSLDPAATNDVGAEEFAGSFVDATDIERIFEEDQTEGDTVAATPAADAQFEQSGDPELASSTAEDTAGDVELGEEISGVFEDASAVVEEPAAPEPESLTTAAEDDPYAAPAFDDVPAKTGSAVDATAAPVEDDPYAAPDFGDASAPAASMESVVDEAPPAAADAVEDDPYAAPDFGDQPEPAASEVATEATAASPADAVEDDPYAAPDFGDEPPAATAGAVEDDPYAAPTFDEPAAAVDDAAAPTDTPAETTADEPEPVAASDADDVDANDVAASTDDASAEPADHASTLAARVSELLAPIEPSLRRILEPMSAPLRFVPRPLRSAVDVIALSLPVWVPIVWIMLWYLHSGS